MNLEQLKEKMYVENVRMFKEFFLEDDEDIKYVITNTENEEDFRIVYKEELMELLHKELKLEYVEEGFCLGLLNNESVKIEHL